MKPLNLKSQINDGINEFVNETFTISSSDVFINENDFLFISSLSFNNCTFKGSHLEFENINNPEFHLGFFECNFEISLDIKNCNFKKLGFRNCKSEKDINIIGGNYLNFYFRNTSLKTKTKNIISGNLYISDIKVAENVSMDNLNITGNLDFSDNILSVNANKNRIKFSNSTFNEANFEDNQFLSKSYFNDVSGINFLFNSCKFQKLKFNNAFFLKCVFSYCDFYSTTWFEDYKKYDTQLKFVACEFKGFSLFNNSKIDFLNIDRCTFDKSSSFTDTEFNILRLNEVRFGGGAYFDEMKIKKVLDKSYLKDKSKILEWKRTLRAIKQELQKTENKIDFNRFRSYELAAHYKELSIWSNFKDTSILWTTKWTTNFGLSWTRAFWFTIISGFIWYTILYSIENSGEYNPEQVENYFISLFRFFLITDFYSPFNEGRSYLSNIESWIPFILGKIFIAFGIYEMIQSFRKFKA